MTAIVSTAMCISLLLLGGCTAAPQEGVDGSDERADEKGQEQSWISLADSYEVKLTRLRSLDSDSDTTPVFFDIIALVGDSNSTYGDLLELGRIDTIVAESESVDIEESTDTVIVVDKESVIARLERHLGPWLEEGRIDRDDISLSIQVRAFRDRTFPIPNDELGFLRVGSGWSSDDDSGIVVRQEAPEGVVFHRGFFGAVTDDESGLDDAWCVFEYLETRF